MNLKTRTLALEIAMQATAVKPHIIFLDCISEQQEVARREKHRALLILVEQSHGASIWRFGKLAEDAAPGTH